MSNFVVFQVQLISANATLIDKITKMVLGAEATEDLTLSETKPTKPVAKPADKPAPADESGMDLATFKDAAKKSKADHGEDFTMQVLKDAGVEVKTTLGRSMGAVSTSDYDTIVASWVTGPTTSTDSDDDWDDDDDDLGGDAVLDPAAVQTALKAYSASESREAAKKVMTDNGAKKLSNVVDCTQEQLAAMMKVIV